MKRIAVTCKCGNRIVESVPGEVIAGGAHPVLTCDKCHQEYVIIGNKLRRFARGMLGAELTLKEQDKLPVDAELADGVELNDKAAWEQPTTKTIQ